MKLVILDGARCNESDADCHGGDAAQVSRALVELAARHELSVVRFPLADMKMAPCLGDFECWTKTPGRCRTHDGAQEIAQAMHDAHLVVMLSPITFGGYSSDLKKAVDRLIGLVHPNFHDRDGLTRHQPRYDHYAPMLFVGVSGRPYSESAQTWAELTAGNAVNLIAPGFLSCIVSTAETGWPDRLEDVLSRALAGELTPPVGRPERTELLDACSADAGALHPASPPRSAVLLIGSARPKGSSTSELLANRMLSGLVEAGVATKTVYANQFIKAGRLAEQALNDMLAADLLVVSTPIYVDGLPYLVVSALEQLTARLHGQPHALGCVTGILNCGYPEAIHNRIAMRMLRNFAHQAQLRWVGGLALGGGEILQSRARAAAGLVARDAFRALTLAADALASGDVVSDEAIRLMARPLVPSGVFRGMARLRWIMKARPNGVSRKALSGQPWAERLP